MNHETAHLTGGETLRGDFFDVWTLDLGRAAAFSSCLQPLLDPEERRRAARFLRAEHGDRFRAARGLLRLLLARYLDRPPDQLRFDTGPYGKPHLAEGQSATPLEFNVSHSGDVAAYCVSQWGPVGVDVEWIRPLRDLESLLRRVATDGELCRFRQTPADAQLRWFFRLWTRKEAVAKAVGEGMRLPFDRLPVMGESSRRDPRAPSACRLAVPEREGNATSEWLIRDFPFHPDYCGAVATPVARPGPLRRWHVTVDSRGKYRGERLEAIEPAPPLEPVADSEDSKSGKKRG